MDTVQNINAAPAARRPWNKGKLVGPKPPLQPKHVWAIRTRLQMQRKVRDLALFNLAIDSKLRGCDVVSLKVEDIALMATRWSEQPSRTDNLALLAGTLAIISTPVTGLAGNTACVSAAASILCADAGASDLAQSFDLIFSSMMLHWFSMLCRWQRWLKPEGVLCVVVPIAGSLGAWQKPCEEAGVRPLVFSESRFRAGS